MAIKLNTTSGSITLDAEDGSGNVNVTLPRAGFESGDITGVTAGTGLTGGGASGAVTLTVGAAQTGITSIYATDLILGEDTQTAIDFGTVNEIDFKVDNAARLTMTSGALYPVTTNQIDLGTASLEFKDAFFDGTVTADAFAGPLTGNAATLTTNANLTGHVTSTGNAAVLGSFTSAQLSTALSDETGSGAAVFGTAPTLTGATLAGELAGADNTVSRVNLKDYGEVTNAIGGTGGGTQDIDLTLGNAVSATVDTSANTFTFSNPTASDELCGFVLFLTNGGSQTVTWPGTVDWPSATAPTLSSSGVDIIVFQTIDGGTTWHGQVASTLSS